MDKKTVAAILAALNQGLRVEIIRQKDGSILVQTVKRKQLKI